MKRCSFCGKSRDEVRVLIQGGEGLYICDNCVATCNAVIDEESDLNRVKRFSRKLREGGSVGE